MEFDPRLGIIRISHTYTAQLSAAKASTLDLCLLTLLSLHPGSSPQRTPRQHGQADLVHSSWNVYSTPATPTQFTTSPFLATKHPATSARSWPRLRQQVGTAHLQLLESNSHAGAHTLTPAVPCPLYQSTYCCEF